MKAPPEASIRGGPSLNGCPNRGLAYASDLLEHLQLLMLVAARTRPLGRTGSRIGSARFAVLGLTVFLATVPGVGTNAVEPYRSLPGRFEVELPGQPRTETESWLTLLGRVKANRYIALRSMTEFAVEHFDVPRIALRFYSPESILERAADSFVEDAQGRDAMRRPARCLGRPCLAVEFSHGRELSKRFRGRFLMDAERIYTVSIDAPETENPPFAKFFGSFAITEDGDLTSYGE